ncbi:hypothetical protein [Sphingomonas sp. T9W2]|uniref:hypothetical protein n=1 Tax=Sphingomonas sp. T9W2 TaxID=3143183 RepID=UPI0031F4ACCA
MGKVRSVATHLTAAAIGAAITGPLVFAYGHTVEGIDAGDLLSLPNTIIGALIGGLVTYFLTPKPVARGGRDQIRKALDDLVVLAIEVRHLDPDSIGDASLLDRATTVASRLTKAADRYQFARALTPPDESSPEWHAVDDAVLEMKSALRDADRNLAAAAVEHGPTFLRAHLGAVRDRFGAPLESTLERARP